MKQDLRIPQITSDMALFLDLDGTLVEIAETPESVTVGPRVIPTLTALLTMTGGAVALISGRPIAAIDRLLAPLKLSVAGLHGLERRCADGTMALRATPLKEHDHLRAALETFATQHPGVLVEDKGATLALHFRGAPEAGGDARALIRTLVEPLCGRAHLQEGKMVLEIRPADGDKGQVIETFMDEMPFTGRTPVFIGDDVTDEIGFAAVNRLGGHSIRIGRTDETAAQAQLDSVADLLDWLTVAITAVRKRAVHDNHTQTN